jgi:serine/threonine protein kinase
MIADTRKGTRELQIIRTISDRIKNRPGSWQLCEFIDSFFHQGPNGTHQCLVQELLGPTLSTVLNFYGYDEDNRKYLRPSTVIKISKQLLETVASLHSVKSHTEVRLRLPPSSLADSIIFGAWFETALFSFADSE